MNRSFSLSKLNILIVEDDEDQAFLEKEKLENAFPDSTIEVAHNAEECLKKDFPKYHLILLDLNLPDIFGLDLLAQIQMACDVPVVIVTGEDDISFGVSALKSGAYDYIVKTGNAFEVLPVVVENTIKNYMTKKESEILRERLIQSEKLASIGKLVSGVAHEINNPLTAILGFSELLIMRSSNGIKDKLEKIRECALRCKKTVEDLLCFAREHKAEKKLLRVHDIIERSLSIGSNLIKMFDIKVEKILEEPSPCILADKFHMQQVFVNIISNACHAMKESATKILTISVESNAETVIIKFMDTGHGIPEKNLNKIFDPFFTTKDIGEGSGLGLSICYGIIKEHSGQIHAESRPNEGATFIIELPKAIPSTLVDEEEKDRDYDNYTFHHLSILIVEDEESICDFYKDALDVENNTIHFAHSGKEAIDKLTCYDFDLIILDLRMPEVDGKKLYNFIKDKKPHLLEKILICTGDVISQDIKDFFKGVNNIILNKPFSLLDFKKAISCIIKKKSHSMAGGS